MRTLMCAKSHGIESQRHSPADGHREQDHVPIRNCGQRQRLSSIRAFGNVTVSTGQAVLAKQRCERREIDDMLLDASSPTDCVRGQKLLPMSLAVIHRKSLYLMPLLPQMVEHRRG